MEHRRVLAILDRMAHPSTTPLDLEQSLAGFFRVLNGKLPSDVLGSAGPPAKPRRHRSYDAFQEEINDLKAKLRDVEAEKNGSERAKQRQISALIGKIAELQAKLDSKKKPANRDSYTYAEVLQVMVDKFGKHHGVGAALIERNARLIMEDDQSDRISDGAFTKWRRQNAFPMFVVEQIEAMTSDDLLPRMPWSAENREFLVALYTSDERQSNQTLAKACSMKFNRRITVCSIKGELDRLRRKGKVGQYRPA